MANDGDWGRSDDKEAVEPLPGEPQVEDGEGFDGIAVIQAVVEMSTKMLNRVQRGLEEGEFQRWEDVAETLDAFHEALNQATSQTTVTEAVTTGINNVLARNQVDEVLGTLRLGMERHALTLTQVERPYGGLDHYEREVIAPFTVYRGVETQEGDRVDVWEFEQGGFVVQLVK